VGLAAKSEAAGIASPIRVRSRNALRSWKTLTNATEESSFAKSIALRRDATAKHLETLHALKPELKTESEMAVISGAIYETETANKRRSRWIEMNLPSAFRMSTISSLTPRCAVAQHFAVGQ
jgi:hypothetical protein